MLAMVRQVRMHACPVPGCGVRIPGEHLMCAKHWYCVPKGLRDRVWREYLTRQGSGTHREAMAEAIRAVEILTR